MSRMVRLGMHNRSWMTLWEREQNRLEEEKMLQTQKAPKQDVQDCSHPEWKRHGNRHGSYATCILCHMRVKWSPELDAWQSTGQVGSRKSSLPSPSSSGILPPPLTTQSKSRPQPPRGYLRSSQPTSRSPSVTLDSELHHPEVYHMDFEETASQDLNFQWEHQM